MRIAEILSDLTSLRVCDPSAALALVSARPSPSATTADNAKPKGKNADDDAELARAKDLIDLHYSVKMQHSEGTVDEGLLEARYSVHNALKGVT
ncbi:hypothetical protein NA57DRAFT_75129 [Rhizodiscina lignyota]|uniref:Uncharacterized protein n=1 Tax=Rhizodiscina lignyota TaxID=1504668 RepID=A0A9P4M9R2_9PEZI|nr:hypothetical protein NA57DRAFT_75129 [Rhizodiscina lignyota]